MSATYQASPGVYDEAFQKGASRPHWEPFWNRLNRMGREELLRRVRQADEFLDENGVTYGALSDDSANQRPWKLDPVPMIMEEATWKGVEEGIAQRARLYDALIRDLYGPQQSLSEGIIAPESIFSHERYLRPAIGLHNRSRSLTFYAAELARSQDGRIWVMADRSDAPTGIGFALENRIIANRTMSSLRQAYQIRKLAPFFAEFKRTLKSLSPRKVEHPRIALLSAGPSQPNYFEDVYLARYLGFDLTQGSDLAVRNDQVFLKTLAGLVPVDVLVLRGTETAVDSLEFGGGAPHGVPGLLQAIRGGHVATVNTPGCGLIEAPVFMAQLPAACEYFLGESLKLPSIATWWCQRARDREYVFENLRSLVIKPAFSASGGEERIGADLTKHEVEVLRKAIDERPADFVAQELIARSAVPMVSESGTLKPGHIAMRAFAVADKNDYTIMPGGLIRASKSSGPMELSIAGGETSKDLWIITSEPDRSDSLLPGAHSNVPLKRTSATFPSRVADDLFWLGQSLEKADLLARMIRCLVVRVDVAADTDSLETVCLTRALADLGAIEPGFVISEMAESLPKLSESLVSVIPDAGHSKGIAPAVSEIIRLSSLVRDWISPETWQQLHRAGSEFFEQLNQPTSDLSSLADAFDDLVLTLASAMGLVDNGMIRGPAWRFLDIGRRIERARTSATFLGSILEGAIYEDAATLKMVIEVADCQMTYRSRYLDDIHQNAVFDLCVTDSTNPRSIISQLEAISQHVDVLPDSTGDPLRNDEKRLAMSALHRVRMLTSEDLGAENSPPLTAVLAHVQDAMRDLANLLERKYLLHSGTPRQLIDNTGVIA